VAKEGALEVLVRRAWHGSQELVQCAFGDAAPCSEGGERCLAAGLLGVHALRYRSLGSEVSGGVEVMNDHPGRARAESLKGVLQPLQWCGVVRVRERESVVR
jgi:hypothetical protein